MTANISWPTHPPKQDSAAMPLRGKKPVPAIRKQEKFAKPSPSVDVPSLIKPALGLLQCEVLQQLCSFGKSTARQVLERMPRPLAYTPQS